MDYLSKQQIENIKNGELGSASTEKFLSILNDIKNGIVVDIGVCEGNSSSLMLNKSIENNVKVFGIDPIPYFMTNHPNYTYMKDDSVKVGRDWTIGPVDLVFFDSVHAKEQVLCELLYWWSLIKEGGYAIFHDTSWLDYLHKPGHRGAGKKPGNSRNGYDSYGGRDWETPDKAINEFFNVNLYPDYRDINDDKIVLIHEDEYIKVETNFASLGMTFIQKKKHFDYRNNIKNWEEVIKLRKILLLFFQS